MGVVYSAHDPLIERTVAIKTVGCAGLSREEAEAFEQRFYREAKSAGRLNHPNIVTIHDVGRSDDLAYIAMEFLAGQSLRDILDSGVVLPPDRIADIAAQIADGLAFAHANDVVHRDIKPANIMVLDNDTVKIADFGVALLPSGSHTVAGTAFGSPKYMSPEQVTGQKADGRSDIFSLGAVLYEMLTGRPPFAGDDLNAILYQVLNSAPPLPSSHNPRLPPGFDIIVGRAMAKDPERRYQSAAEMAADLRNYRRLAGPTQEAQKPNTDSAPPAAAKRSVIGPGDATMPLKTVAVPTASATKATTAPRGGYAPALRYGVPLLVVVLLGGWFLLRPAAPQPPAVASAPVPGSTASATENAAPPAPSEAAPSVPAASATTPTVPPVAAEGRIRLAIAPWGEVYVDGKKAGISPPLTELRLPVGKHTIEIRNATFAAHRQNVDLTPDASLRIKHKFQ
jgi:serine/threonine-protein kinase